MPVSRSTMAKMKRALIFSAFAGVEARARFSSEYYEVLLDQFAGEGTRPHGRLSGSRAGGDAQPGVEGKITLGIDGREFPDVPVLLEVDPDVVCGSNLVAAGGEAVPTEPKRRPGRGLRRLGFEGWGGATSGPGRHGRLV